jgi:hypothetical protein
LPAHIKWLIINLQLAWRGLTILVVSRKGKVYKSRAYDLMLETYDPKITVMKKKKSRLWQKMSNNGFNELR